MMWMYDGRYNPGTPAQAGGTALRDSMLYKYGRLYFNDFYGTTCLDATDGTELWHTYLSRETFAQGVTYAYGRIYVVTEVRKVKASFDLVLYSFKSLLIYGTLSRSSVSGLPP